MTTNTRKLTIDQEHPDQVSHDNNLSPVGVSDNSPKGEGTLVRGSFQQLGEKIQQLGEELVAHLSTPKTQRNSMETKRLIENLILAFEDPNFQAAVAPGNTANLLKYLSDFLSADKVNYSFEEEPEYLDTIIRCENCILTLTPDGDPSLPDVLDKLGAAFNRRFWRLGDMEDIELAIGHHTQSVSLITGSEDSNTKARLFHNLGIAYQNRFTRLERLTDIDNAILYQEQALKFTGAADPKLLHWLESLAISHKHRFRVFGSLEDVDKAIAYETQILRTDSPNHLVMVDRLSRLGTAFMSRFGKLNRPSDLDKSIEYLIKAESFIDCSTSQESQALLLNNLGSAYSRRFQYFKKSKDIDDAIRYHTRALDVTPSGHASMSNRLSELGSSYRARAFQLNQRLDITKAVECHTKALEVTPKDHGNLPNMLNELGLSLHEQYTHCGNAEALDKAIEIEKEAVALTSHDRPDLPRLLNCLGTAYLTRFSDFKDLNDFENAFEAFQQAALTQNGRPNDKFTAARTWGQLATLCLNSEHLRAYQTAMDLVPEFSWLGSSVEQRFTDMRLIRDSTVEAIAVAISSKEFGLALEWMEQGRSVVWNQILQLRTPIEDLAVVNPELAGRLSQIMNQLNKDPDSTMTDGFNDLLGAERTIQQRHRVAEEYEKLIQQARAIPGFQGFLKRQESKAIMSCARRGYVVVINAHESRCDALVLHPDHSEITHIPLPNLTLNRAATAQAQIEASLRHQNIRERGFHTGTKKAVNERGKFKDALYFLWMDIVKPILDALELEPMVDVLPRITWCTTGALSFLPLHAAGDYGHPQERIYNYAITSYTPTLSAMMPRTTSEPLNSIGIKVLAVAQSKTPGHSDLPETLQELENIRRHIHEPHQFTRLEGGDATIDTVMQALESHSWVHLACHAHQNTSNPTQSGFFLQDGVLSITQIAHKSLKNKGLAFLSACQTATGKISIADESVHLAAGMLVAGYPSVIATMWAIKDDDAPVVADCVYKRLCGNEKAELHDSPEALHYAVAELRNKVGEEALVWQNHGNNVTWTLDLDVAVSKIFIQPVDHDRASRQSSRPVRCNRFISVLGNHPYGARPVYRVSGTKPPGRSLTTLLDTVESPIRSGGNKKRPTSKKFYIPKEPISLLPEDEIVMEQRTRSDELQQSTQTLVFEKQEILPDPELSEEQKYVFDKVMSGKNVFFTGSAGTGKSVLLRAIIAALGGPSYEVAVTASTGIAATNIGGQTLHSFAGVGLGHGDIKKMVLRVKRDPAALTRWLKAKILIIDEVSMVDASWFDQLEEIARQIRGKKAHFGGIQLVVCGDFFQLPPIANRDRIDAPASFVFDSFSWETCIKTKVMLTQVYRQKDPKLVKMLNDARVGVVTDESAKLLTNLARRVHYEDDIGTTELYPRRWDAYWANVAQLARLPGEGRTFYAYDRHGKTDDENEVDPERAKLLFGRMIVPKRLRLKVGAQVMCLRNINARGLVNGSLGKVVDFMKPSQVRSYSENDSQWSIVGSIRPPSGESGNISPGDTNVPGRITRTAGAYEFYEKAEWPLVQFTNGQCVLMTPTNFTVETSTGVVEVERLQVPLVLAWALTVHKSQGQTLERVRINLQRTFEKGQAYVALSRCTSLETLEVYGFDRERVQAHPRVQQWARTVMVLNSFTQLTSSSRLAPRVAAGGQ